jgi:hypothetical protein
MLKSDPTRSVSMNSIEFPEASVPNTTIKNM